MIAGINCNICGSGDIALKYTKQDIRSSADVLECKACGLVFLRQEEKAIRQEDMYWDGAKQENIYLDEKIEERTKRDFKKKLKFINKHVAKGSLFDVGCGTGQFLKLAEDDGWDVCGLDISAQAARLAREKYGVRVFVGRPEEIDLAGKCFDCVTMWDVVEHLKDPRASLAVLASKIKEGGILVIRTPNERALTRRIARGVRYFGNPAFLKYAYYTPHYFYYDARNLSVFLSSLNLKVEVVQLENTETMFARSKIQTHYKGAQEKNFVSILFPLVQALAHFLRISNKLVVFARRGKRT